jgi:NhaA family Na+:H+ antiporter
MQPGRTDALVGPPRKLFTTMHRHPSEQDIPRAQRLTERAFETLERFLHVEAVSGIVLLIAAAAALIWANSPLAASYHDLWHAPVVLGVGAHVFTQSLHFWINDGLMTVFFLVVGMEIRREIHEGALANLQLATLPIAAAAGGVAVPALLYVALNGTPPQLEGWAVPTATDIAFAVGVLALLGRSIPGNVRVLLLALAVIDDLAAVLIIAIFYSGGLDYMGFVVAGAGIVLTLGLQRMGIGAAWAYVLPGAVVWIGMLQTGAHPTLAGVVLGLITPVRSRPMREPAMDTVTRAANDMAAQTETAEPAAKDLSKSLRELRLAQRELIPPVVRVQMALHAGGAGRAGAGQAAGRHQRELVGGAGRPVSPATRGELVRRQSRRPARRHRLHDVDLHRQPGLHAGSAVGCGEAGRVGRIVGVRGSRVDVGRGIRLAAPLIRDPSVQPGVTPAHRDTPIRYLASLRVACLHADPCRRVGGVLRGAS